MSRSGYMDSCDSQEERWALVRWRGAVNSAIKGKRGQAFLHELLASMEAMPEKRLIAHDLEADGSYCTLGVVGSTRGINMAALDPENSEKIAMEFGLAEAMVREIVFMNDEYAYGEETPGERWHRMRQWVASQITPAP